MTIKITRICAGEYVATNGTESVTISRITFWDGPGWVAIRDRGCYSDPLPFKRDAVREAQSMLAE